jgi:hypothetical protein
MPPSVEVDIDPRFGGLNLGIMSICSRQHLPHWMWQLGVSFFMWKKVLPSKVLFLEGQNGEVWKDC